MTTSPLSPAAKSAEQMLSTLRRAREAVYTSGVCVGKKGKRIDAFPTGLTEKAGRVLAELTRVEGCATTIETGFALGFSASFLIEGMLEGRQGTESGEQDRREIRHVAIDPYATGHWDSIGLKLLEEGGVGTCVRLIEEESCSAMARLAAEGFRADLGFVDGGHHFETVMIDLFWMGRVVRPGGLVVVDDLWMPSVRAGVEYFEKNLLWNREVSENPDAKRYAVLRLPEKAVEREWDHFVGFDGKQK